MIYQTKEDYRSAWEAIDTKDPPIPLNLDIELASACNARCTFCLYGDREWDASMGDLDWDGKPKKRLMQTKMAMQLINDAEALGIPAIKFNFRGESVIHPEYGKIIKYAASRIHDPEGWARFGLYAGGNAGKRKFFDLLANTNGNIPLNLWESSIDGLMAATKVMVSLDSLDPEIYHKIRIGLSLDNAIRTINELVKRGHPDLWVRRVVCKINKDEPFVQKAKERWPNGVKVSEHFAFDRNHYQEQELTGEDPSNWPRRFCGYPAQRVVVEASGRYVPCCIAWAGEFDAGKYPILSLKDYWASEWRRNLVEELRRGEFKNDKCKSCTSFMAYDVPQRANVRDVEGKAILR